MGLLFEPKCLESLFQQLASDDDEIVWTTLGLFNSVLQQLIHVELLSASDWGPFISQTQKWLLLYDIHLLNTLS
jgi:hypothetical protein